MDKKVSKGVSEFNSGSDMTNNKGKIVKDIVLENKILSNDYNAERVVVAENRKETDQLNKNKDDQVANNK